MSNWTVVPHYGVSHLVTDDMQYTVIQRSSFVEVEYYSKVTCKLIKILTFFVQPATDKVYNDNNRFWNCGSIKQAISIAKHYVESGCGLVEDCKNDLSKLDCPDLNKNDTD